MLPLLRTMVCGVLLPAAALANTYGCKDTACCKDHCKVAGYCCNGFVSQSSNHLFSCLQGCAMRVAGEDKETVLARCKSADSSGPCSFTHESVGTMNLCGNCPDSEAPGADKTKCAFGVAKQSACVFGVNAVWELSEQHGWIFLFFGAVVAAVYLGGGMAKGGGVRKHPHQLHFTEVAALVRDGVAFVRSRGNGKGKYRHLGLAVSPSSSPATSPKALSSPKKKKAKGKEKKEKSPASPSKKKKTKTGSKSDLSKTAQGGGPGEGGPGSAVGAGDGFGGLLQEERDEGAGVHSSQAKVKVVSLM